MPADDSRDRSGKGPKAQSSKARPSKARPPTADERALWEWMVRDVTPLSTHGDLVMPVTLPDPPLPDPPVPEAPADPAPAPPPAVQKPASRKQPPPAPAPPRVQVGDITGMDRRMAERFRRGRLAIESRIDLHGMTRAAARDALAGFIARSAGQGRRCVLIITGKGRTREEGGVLKREVPLWLNQADLRPYILAVNEAQPHHGGEGALYVLIRRRREG